MKNLFIILFLLPFFCFSQKITDGKSKLITSGKGSTQVLVKESSTPPPFDPLDYPNFLCWLKAGVGRTLNSGYISLWADTSGNDNDAAQSNAGYQADGVTDSLNGYPVAHFDGINDVMNLLSNPELSGDFTIYLVAKKYDSGYHPFMGDQDYSVLLNYTDGNLYVAGIDGLGLIYAATGQLTSWSIITITYNRSTGIATFNVNGSSFSASYSGVLDSVVLNQIGGRRNEVWANIYLAEFLEYGTAHNAATQSLFINYLNTKFNIF